MQPANNSNRVNNIAKLKWACRRGMLELDVLLGNFLKEVYFKLDTENQNYFIELLNYPDPTLFTWLFGQATPSDERLVTIIEKIREHARSRLQI